MKRRSLWRIAATSTLVAGSIFSFALSAKASPAPLAKANATSRARDLVALGDSITFGYNLNLGDKSKPSKLAFPFLVGRETGLSVVDLATPGWTTTDLLRALETQKYQSALKQAALVTVDIGSNDLLHVSGGLIQQALLGQPVKVTPDQAKDIQAAELQVSKNVPQIIERIREQTSAPIFLLNVYDPFSDQSPLHATGEKMVSAVNQTIQAESNCVLVDAYGRFNHKQATLILPLDVHPSMSGQQVLANAVLAAIDARPNLLPGYQAARAHRPARLKVASSLSTMTLNGHAKITGVLEDVYGAPVSNAFVDIVATAGKIESSVRSDRKGRFSATYTAPTKPCTATVKATARATSPPITASVQIKVKR